jgi:hypothetical protein
MSIKQIIKELMDKNPLGLKEALAEALAEELRTRVALALEAKMNEETEESFELDEALKDLGHGIRVNVDSDNSMVIGDRSAPGGSQMVVLEKDQVKKMISVITADKPVKAVDLGKGVKMTLDSDGDAVISDTSTPVGRQMVVLTAKQIQEILKLVK